MYGAGRGQVPRCSERKYVVQGVTEGSPGWLLYLGRGRRNPQTSRNFLPRVTPDFGLPGLRFCKLSDLIRLSDG